MSPDLAALRYRIRDVGARLHTRYLTDVFFVHVNKTAGTSIERALGLPFQHRTARELRALAGAARWERGFSFAFVRNPWDKVASHYRFRVRTDQTGLGGEGPGFEEWVELAYGDRDPRYYDQPRMFMPQVDWISDAEDRILVDYVGRFERLEEDFAEVCRRLGRPGVRLPHLKRSSREPGGYRALYGDRAAEIVARRFAADLEAFDYEF